jgi:NADPH-dependent 2,4-dienoyl-CoA reductase/sulfur reductase-like enzyme
MASILILGGGFGGLAAAHQLRARLSDDHDVTVVAANDHFYAGFAKLWDLVGTRPLEQGTVSLSALERYGIRFVQTRITAIDPTERRVETEAGSFSADFLLVALGVDPGPEQLLQLHGPAHDLYDANELPSRPAAAKGAGIPDTRPFLLPLFTLLPRETVWKIAKGVLNRVCLVAQDGEMGVLHSLLLTRGTPNWGLSRFFKQSLEKRRILGSPYRNPACPRLPRGGEWAALAGS